MKKYSNIVFIILIFLLIYEPPILKFNILHIIGIISWIYIIFNIRFITKELKIKKLFSIYLVFLLLWIYVVLFGIINKSNIIGTDFIFWLIDVLPACVMVTVSFRKRHYSQYDFLKILLIVGTLQGITSIISFFSPDMQNYFIDLLISYGYGDVYINLAQNRMYGFASNLTYSTPIVQSVLGIIALYLGITQNIKYLWFAPVLFFSAIINARTSYIIIFYGIILLILCFSKNSSKNWIRMGIIIIALIFFLYLGIEIIEYNSPITFIWLKTGLEEIMNFLKGNNDGYFEYITNYNKYTIPEGYGAIFGESVRVMGANKYFYYSDVGFINDIWFGGIIYCCVLYLIFYRLLTGILSSELTSKNLNQFLFLYLTGIFIFTNFKGIIFSMNNFTTMFFLIYAFFALQKNSQYSHGINNKGDVCGKYIN